MDRNNMRNQNAMQSGMPKRPPPSTPYFAQHDELIRYIHGQWHKVMEPSPQGGPRYYQNPPEQRLTDFQPFNLESYWGRRAVQNYHNNTSRGHQ